MKSIVAMCSLQGETVSLKTPVKIVDDVEIWLEDFSREMKQTLADSLSQSLHNMDFMSVPQQIVDLIEAIHFTEQVESIITNKGDLRTLEKSLNTQLEKYTTFDITSLKNSADATVTQLKLKSLIMDTIHSISVVKQLIAAKVTQLADWTWQKQLRFYMNSKKECVIRMNDAEFQYTYEYQGNYSKLVHTPLTDKCYLTLTQAMAAGFGGNPLGPAGTGKSPIKMLY